MTELSKGERTKKKLVDATGVLLRRQGFHATGLADIVAESGAPRGSLYFYFPGGKEDLVAAALAAASGGITEVLETVLANAPTPSDAVRAVVMYFGGQLASSGFEKGCPVATVVLEQAASSDALQAVCARAYGGWRALIEQRLLREGYAAPRASGLATLILSTLEGALLVSRAHRSTEPLEQAGRELVRILEQGDRA